MSKLNRLRNALASSGVSAARKALTSSRIAAADLPLLFILLPARSLDERIPKSLPTSTQAQFHCRPKMGHLRPAITGKRDGIRNRITRDPRG